MEPSTKHPVIDLMEEQKGVTAKGGTMRLGGYPCQLRPDSKAAAAYGATDIVERHRHRYEFNNDYLGDFESHGMIPAGVNPETGLVEVVELTGHPWFVGTQYHPAATEISGGAGRLSGGPSRIDAARRPRFVGRGRSAGRGVARCGDARFDSSGTRSGRAG